MFMFYAITVMVSEGGFKGKHIRTCIVTNTILGPSIASKTNFLYA